MINASLLSSLKVRRNSPLNMNYQIRKGLQDLISAGRIPAGAQMPSVQQLAEICGVSLNTVKYVVRDLVREGVLESRAGIGTFVPNRKPSTTEVFICDTQPEPGSFAWAFHRQIIEGLAEGYGDESRRIFTVYAEEQFLDANEIVASARAKNADCIIAYRPTGEFAGALAEAAEDITCVSLVYSIPNSMAHAVVINPENHLRRMLLKRIEAGRRSFAYISLDLEKSPGIYLAHNPYGRIYRIFRDTLDEAGIEPAVCRVEGKPWDEFPGLPEFERKLNDETTLLCLPSGGNGVLGPRWKGLDIITYTESRNSLLKLERENKSVLYGGLERCGREAALLQKLLQYKQSAGPTIIEVEPEAIDQWSD